VPALRTTLLLNFYRRYPCHLAIFICSPMHVALDASRIFPIDEMGEEQAGRRRRSARTTAWQKYVEACDAGRPWQIRGRVMDRAHMEDMERVRRTGPEDLPGSRQAAQADDPTWQAINQQ